VWIYLLISTSHTLASAASYPIHIPDWFSPKLLRKLNLEPDQYLPRCKEKALIWAILEKGLSWPQTLPLTTLQLLCKQQVIEEWTATLTPELCQATLLLIAKLSKLNTEKTPPPHFSLKPVLTALLQRTVCSHNYVFNPELFTLFTSSWLSKTTALTSFFGSTLKTRSFATTLSSVQESQNISVALTINDNEPAKITHTARNIRFILKGNLSPKAFQYVVKSGEIPLFQTFDHPVSDAVLSQDGTTVALVFLQHYIKVWKICWAKKQPSLREVFFCETTAPLISIMLSRTGDLMFFETKGTHTQKSPYALRSVNLKKHPKVVKLLGVASKPITYKEVSSDGNCFIFMRDKTVFVYLPRADEGPIEISFQEPVEQVKLTQSRLPILVSPAIKKTNKTEWWMLARPFSFFTVYCLNALRSASSNHTMFGILPESLEEKFKEAVGNTNSELAKNRAQFLLHYTFAKKPDDKDVSLALWAHKKNLNKPIYPW